MEVLAITRKLKGAGRNVLLSKVNLDYQNKEHDLVISRGSQVA
jgi:hypothetical protein